MITLNLIPPLQKKELRLLRVFIVIKNVIIYLLLYVTVAAIILLCAKLILQNNFNQVVADYNLNNRTGQLLGQEIKQFNQKLINIQTIQADYTAWSEFLISVNELLPNDVVLYNITLDKQTKEIQISGRAKTRQALLDYQQKLNASAYLEKVEIPLSTLLEKENIDFTIISKFNLDKLP